MNDFGFIDVCVSENFIDRTFTIMFYDSKSILKFLGTKGLHF